MSVIVSYFTVPTNLVDSLPNSKFTAGQIVKWRIDSTYSGNPVLAERDRFLRYVVLGYHPPLTNMKHDKDAGIPYFCMQLITPLSDEVSIVRWVKEYHVELVAEA